MKRGIFRLVLACMFVPFLCFSQAFAAQEIVMDPDISYYRLLKSEKVNNPDAAKVEEIIRYCADAVYETSNGECYLRNVRIFQEPSKYPAEYRTNGIIWNKNGHPMAAAGGGEPYSPLDALGERINMYDNFFDRNTGQKLCGFLENDQNMAFGGYALASLIFCNSYNLRAEYPMVRNGKEYKGLGSPSLMNDPSLAAYNGDAKALELSARSLYNENTSTEQNARWDMSDWELMSLKSFFLKDPEAKKKKNPYSIQTKPIEHSSEAQKHLRIIWVTSPVYVIVIDLSGSMDGERFDKAKAAAKEYVRHLLPGMRVGLVTFSSGVNLVAPVKRITLQGEQAEKSELIKKIDNIAIGGNTAMYDGIYEGVKQILAQQNTEYEGRHIALFTDGEDNSSHISRNQVVTECADRGITIDAVGLEKGVNVKVLQELTQETKGYFVMTTSPIDTQEMIYTYLNHTGETQSSVKDSSLAKGRGDRAGLLVEQGAETLRVSALCSKTGVKNGLAVTLRSPKGKQTAVPYLSDTDKYELVMKKPEPGNWTVELANKDNGSLQSRVLTYISRTDRAMILPYVAVAENADNGSLLFYADVMYNGVPLAGIKVSGQLSRPDGGTDIISFNDNGMDGDSIAGDGIYTGSSANIGKDGNYRMAVACKASGSAQTAVQRYFMLRPSGLGEATYSVKDGGKITVGQFERSITATFQIKDGVLDNLCRQTSAEKPIDFKKLRDKIQMGYDALARNDYDLALDYSKEAMRVNVEDHRIYFLRGKIWDARNKSKNALREYKNAMLYAPYWPENYYRYGQSYVFVNDKSNALWVLERMQRMFPNNKWTNQMEMAYRSIKD